jgi:YggT family protein
MSVFLINLVNDVLVLLTLLIFVRAALSWIPTVDHEHPLVQTITRVTDPILKPVRRLLPLFDGLDLSPIVAVVLLWLVGYIVLRVLAAAHI